MTIPNILERLLIERKNIGQLYHFTSIEGIKHILEDNRILLTKSRGRSYFSTTRDKRFIERADWSEDNFLVAGLVLDGNRLSDNLEIKSHNYWYDEYYNETEGEDSDSYNHTEIKSSGKDEMEERVLVPGKYNIGEFFRGILDFTDYIIVNKGKFIKWLDRTEERDITKFFNWIYEGKYRFTYKGDDLGYGLNGEFIPEDDVREYMEDNLEKIWQDYTNIYKLRVKFQ